MAAINPSTPLPVQLNRPALVSEHTAVIIAHRNSTQLQPVIDGYPASIIIRLELEYKVDMHVGCG